MIHGKTDEAMAMANDEEGQLKLDFTAICKADEVTQPPEPKAAIVPFIDSATRRLRAEAIHRVATAGIFALPGGLKSR